MLIPVLYLSYVLSCRLRSCGVNFGEITILDTVLLLASKTLSEHQFSSK